MLPTVTFAKILPSIVLVISAFFFQQGMSVNDIWRKISSYTQPNPVSTCETAALEWAQAAKRCKPEIKIEDEIEFFRRREAGGTCKHITKIQDYSALTKGCFSWLQHVHCDVLELGRNHMTEECKDQFWWPGKPPPKNQQKRSNYEL